ncbi:helix-turn-helix transcriptional regulator [Streptomyces sp. LP11]|uniref:Helix-turn-helix transcriptional regulator n=1 Tax=Streptomyces pyxinicus TaxID=2970331 RepID=A0ABT2AYA4_9ACTN|nr:helix-turn-helix transcriptional regulator [Streptomyces sp. LP11]MCS0601241.1 helix-turn-helix transcriptional regulator [Streptomyces sp. LP11]
MSVSHGSTGQDADTRRTSHARHGAEELCAAGRELYARALREGQVDAADAADAPCLPALGLLRPHAENPGRLEPVPASVALHRLLRSTTDRIADERRRGARLADAFEPFLRIDGRLTGNGTDTPALRVLHGTARIDEAVTEAISAARQEVWCVRPHHEDHASYGVAVPRDQAFLDRGGRIRALHRHTHRQVSAVAAHYEQLSGDIEARGLDEVTDRLVAVDHTVAFVPAATDGTLALEVRHPALLAYFASTFDRLWRLAAPMFPRSVRWPAAADVTARERAIAALLVEGHTDAVIADRLGMNVRTARLHIARLAATFGSESRTQLGYLLARSGVLDRQEGTVE